MDYRQTKVEVMVVHNNHLLMVRSIDEKGTSYWRLPAAELEEGETPDDGAERALASEVGVEGKITGFIHRRKLKEGPYKMILIYLAELRAMPPALGHDPKERNMAPGSLEIAWRSLRNPELREAYKVELAKAHF